ncbi:MAG TPA: UvrD-helicase domain-containing protein [Woeseiaceae bacterium]|nr:UvrD-helicase domain-containing protein [Woeseiaceae bacterium]
MQTEGKLQAADEAARSSALDITRSFIVQAPAGSGKTELLIQRYLRLLAAVDEPEEVLAITFTRKAAAEMRLRVTGALQSAAQGIVPEQTHLRLTAQAAAAVLAQSESRGWDLPGNAGRMRIQTLDALNASIARMRPMTTTGGAVTNILEDHELTQLYEQAAVATLDWLADDDINGHAARDVLQHVDGNTGIYTAQLAGMLKTRDQWLPFVGSGQISNAEALQLRRAFESALQKTVDASMVELRAVVPLELAAEFLALISYAVKNLQLDGKGDSPICAFGNVPDLPQFSSVDLPRWLALSDFLLTRADEVRRRVTKNEGFPPGDDGQKAAMHAVLAELTSHDEFVLALAGIRDLPPVNYSESQWSVLLSLFRLLPLAVAEFQRLSLARGVSDHIEVALSASAALGSAEEPGDVALLLDYQVRHILVDEMQDTSKTQYRMLEALTGGWEPGDGRTLFCVGDPMQSIYRFRHAEVAQFLAATEKGIGNIELVPLILRKNFRSGEYLVDWFNEVFPGILPRRNNLLKGAVSYASAVPAENLIGQGSCEIHPVFGAEVAREVAVAASVTEALLHAHPGDRIAILVRSRTHLPELLRELRRRRVPYQAIEIDRLTDLPEVIDILALTRAMTHPGDRLAWLALLRSPWFGLDWTDMHRLVQGARHASLPELLADAERLETLSRDAQEILQRRLPLLLQHLDADRAISLRERVERAWYALGGPALLQDRNAVANVYNYLDALARLESSGTLGDNAQFMNQLDTVRVSTSIPARVQIMTMHKAKGLQFEHVLLYGLGRYPASNRPAVLSWLDLPGAGATDEKLVSAIGRRDQLEHDRLHRFIEKTGAGKDRHERGRMLYVACTRAQKSLHLVGHVGVAADGSEIRKPAANSLLSMLWPAVAPKYVEAFSPADDQQTTGHTELYALPVLRRFARPWTLPALEPVPGQGDLQEPGNAELAVEYYWVGLEARLAGTVVHRWLQRLADNHATQGLRLPDNWLVVTRRWLTGLGATDDMLDSITARVDEAIGKVLDDERGRWILGGNGETEFAITGVRRGRVESIVIDRLRVDDDGTHWIIDYKTSSHEGGDLAGFLRAQSDRYRMQLQKYATLYSKFQPAPVRIALYFPLLREFTELDTS